jgi:hypothetical protein
LAISFYLLSDVPFFVYRNSPRFRTLVKAVTTAGTSFSGITGRMISHPVEVALLEEHLLRTSFDA